MKRFPIDAKAKCKGTRSGVSIIRVSSLVMTADMADKGSRSSEKHQLVPQIFGRTCLRKLQQSAQLFTDSVSLAVNNHDSRMRIPVCEICFIQTAEIAYIEGKKHSSCGSGIFELGLITLPDHPFVQGRGNIDPARTKAAN